MASKSLTGGFAYIRDNSTNKDTAYTREERDNLHLRGFMPYAVETIENQLARVAEQLAPLDDLNKHLYLNELCDRNETLFYRYVMDNIKTAMPLVYTPIVGKACQMYAHITRRYRGLYITKYDKGHIEEILRNWPHKDIKVIVITDGERILGLGDQGVNGMGIPIGKLQLYVACAGVNPTMTLPITLDVGCNREAYTSDPFYCGIREKRIRGAEYDAIVEEFVLAVQKVFGPECLIQWEDFANINAFRVLETHRHKYLSFNDDIQGTAAVGLAGLFTALRIKKQKISDQRFLFFGAGMAAVGIANMFLTAFQEVEGIPREQAAKQVYMFNEFGLLTESKVKEQGLKETMAPFIIPTRPDSEYCNKLMDAIKLARPSVLVGASGQGGAFTKEVIETVCEMNPDSRPVIFSLSNPTANSECTAAQAWEYSKERVLFAAGSPFPAYTTKIVRPGATLIPSQGNNCYIFPGFGLACVAAQIKTVPESLLMTAAHALSDMVRPEEMETDSLYPRIERIREVSIELAVVVANKAIAMGLSRLPAGADVRKIITDMIYNPQY